MIFYSPDQAINTPYLSCISWSGPHQTRGIDLKLPDGFRAAVTLGPGITAWLSETNLGTRNSLFRSQV